jgi:hypothetical protein
MISLVVSDDIGTFDFLFFSEEAGMVVVLDCVITVFIKS